MNITNLCLYLEYKNKTSFLFALDHFIAAWLQMTGLPHLNAAGQLCKTKASALMHSVKRW